jgi:hypothetical protein
MPKGRREAGGKVRGFGIRKLKHLPLLSEMASYVRPPKRKACLQSTLSLRILVQPRWWLSEQVWLTLPIGPNLLCASSSEQRPSPSTVPTVKPGPIRILASLPPFPPQCLVIHLIAVINRCNAFPMASWVGRRPSLSQHG